MNLFVIGRTLCFVLTSLAFFHQSLLGQSTIDIATPNVFAQASNTWRTAGAISSDYRQENTFRVHEGNGVLVNIPGRGQSSNVFTKETIADADIDLEYAVARHARAGLWLQGRYLINLGDSWGELTASPYSNGGVPSSVQDFAGKSNFQKGYAPRQSVSKAPGLWQRLRISFRAPQFDSQGRKTADAQLLRVELNGVLIHELVTLKIPTAGGPDQNESPRGPLGIMSSGGAIAFKNFVVKKYDTPLPLLTSIRYTLFSGKFENPHQIGSAKPEKTGTLPQLSIGFIEKDNEYLVRFSGTVQIFEPSKYVFQRETMGGSGYVKINNKLVSDIESYDTDSIELAPGTYPFEVVYNKQVNWLPPSFGLKVASAGIRETALSDESSVYNYGISPLFLHANSNTVHRSFVDLPFGMRVTHAVNVGHPEQLHYTYDMNTGMLLQVWRGMFLDVTPMWHDRGDGSSKPMGARQLFDKPRYSLIKSIPVDSTQAQFRSTGYELDNYNVPTFLYTIYGAPIRDRFEVSKGGGILTRTIHSANSSSGLRFLIASGRDIKQTADDLFVVNGEYYIQINGKVKPSIERMGDNYALQAPLDQTVSYSVIL